MIASVGFDDPEMKFAVMGAGAVGCYFGGMLARAGHSVVLIGRQQHVDAVRREGLFMETLSFQAHVPMQADTDARGIAGAKVVLCCVKSTDSATAAREMTPHLEPDALVLSLQNGVDNALSAITQLPYGRLVQGEGVDDVMRDVVEECLAVAQATGVIVPGEIWEAVQNIARTMPTQFSSTAQDLARHKHSEIDHLNGHVLRLGETLGIHTPVNRSLYALVKLLESRGGVKRESE